MGDIKERQLLLSLGVGCENRNVELPSYVGLKNLILFTSVLIVPRKKITKYYPIYYKTVNIDVLA